MQKIKPAEVSALLKKQLESADIKSSFDEIGTVLEVGDGIARVYGLQMLSTVSLFHLRMVFKEWF